MIYMSIEYISELQFKLDAYDRLLTIGNAKDKSKIINIYWDDKHIIGNNKGNSRLMKGPAQRLVRPQLKDNNLNKSLTDCKEHISELIRALWKPWTAKERRYLDGRINNKRSKYDSEKYDRIYRGSVYSTIKYDWQDENHQPQTYYYILEGIIIFCGTLLTTTYNKSDGSQVIERIKPEDFVDKMKNLEKYNTVTIENNSKRRLRVNLNNPEEIQRRFCYWCVEIRGYSCSVARIYENDKDKLFDVSNRSDFMYGSKKNVNPLTGIASRARMISIPGFFPNTINLTSNDPKHKSLIEYLYSFDKEVSNKGSLLPSLTRFDPKIHTLP